MYKLSLELVWKKELGNKIEKVIGEEGEYDNEIKEHGGTLEGLVRPCFSTAVFEAVTGLNSQLL